MTEQSIAIQALKQAGASLARQLQNSEQNALRFEGKARGLLEVHKSVIDMIAKVDAAAKGDGPEGESLTDSEYRAVKKWLVRVEGAIKSLELSAESSRTIERGRAQGFTASLELIRRDCARLAQIAERVETDEGAPTPDVMDRPRVHAVEPDETPVDETPREPDELTEDELKEGDVDAQEGEGEESDTE